MQWLAEKQERKTIQWPAEKGKKSLKIPTMVIRICKMKKNRHYNVKRKSTNNDLQNITQKI